jgi:hypothetical protein
MWPTARALDCRRTARNRPNSAGLRPVGTWTAGGQRGQLLRWFVTSSMIAHDASMPVFCSVGPRHVRSGRNYSYYFYHLLVLLPLTDCFNGN